MILQIQSPTETDPFLRGRWQVLIAKEALEATGRSPDVSAGLGEALDVHAGVIEKGGPEALNIYLYGQHPESNQMVVNAILASLGEVKDSQEQTDQRKLEAGILLDMLTEGDVLSPNI